MQYPKDILNLIYEYLNGCELLLIQTIDSNIKFNKIISKQILNRIYELGFDNNFINALIKSDAIISGSFILQILFSEYWSNSDIDIYKPFDDDNMSEIENYCWKKIDNNVDYYETATYNITPVPNFIKIHRVRTYIINKMKVQIIHVDIRKYINNNIKILDILFEQILPNFDFKFCMNLFDGLNIKIHYTDSIKKEINHIQNRRKSDSEFNTKELNLLLDDLFDKRILKYKDRGFNVGSYIYAYPGVL